MRVGAQRTRDESGFTLPELLVAMVLMGIVLSLVLAAVVAVFRGNSFTDQDSEALGALRTGLDRFEKEIRQARRIYPDSDSQEVRFWVDYDRDNQQDLEEQITWRVEDGSDGGVLVTHTDATGSPVDVVTRSFVYDTASDYFLYNDVDPGKATVIEVRFSADASVDEFAPERTVRTQVRLRNATKEVG